MLLKVIRGLCLGVGYVSCMLAFTLVAIEATFSNAVLCLGIGVISWGISAYLGIAAKEYYRRQENLNDDEYTQEGVEFD